MMQFETGNGITLCRDCHRLPHEQFNRRPDLLQPMDAEGGEQIDLLTYHYFALSQAEARWQTSKERYYFVSDATLRTFRNLQGIPQKQVIPGTRVRQAYLIWRQTPRAVLEGLLNANGFSVPENFLQIGPVAVITE